MPAELETMPQIGGEGLASGRRPAGRSRSIRAEIAEVEILAGGDVNDDILVGNEIVSPCSGRADHV